MDVLDRVRDDGHPPGAPPRPFQFTLRTMFLVTTVVAVVLGGLSVPGKWEWVRVLTAFYLAVSIPIVLVVALIYGRGSVRTFAIGTLFPAGALLWVMLWSATFFGLAGASWTDLGLPDDPERRRLLLSLATAIAVCLILLGGLIAVVVRRMVKPRRIDWDPLKFVRESAAGDETPTPGRGTTPGHTPEEGVHDRP